MWRMDVAQVLTRTRRGAGLSQRALAAVARVPQSTVARIESGTIDPRASTLDRLLRACGQELAVTAVTIDGNGIDRTLIREQLRLTPTERVTAVTNAARFTAAVNSGVPRAP